MIIWFKIFVGLVILVVVVFYGIYIWNYLPNYKKIRIYVSNNDISDVERAWNQQMSVLDKEYSIENIGINIHKIRFFVSSNKKESCYKVKSLTEGKYTIVLAQYDKSSKGRPINFEKLDNFMKEKMNLKLK